MDQLPNDAAFPELDDGALAELEALGARRPVVAGEYLFRAGDDAYDFYVILSGAAQILLEADGRDEVVATHGPRKFLGELNLLTGQRPYLSARVSEPGEVIVVPVAVLREVLNTKPALSDIILSTFMARRTMLLTGAAAALRVIGSRFSPESLALREFLARNRIPHEWVDADDNPAVEQLLRDGGVAPDEMPVVITTGQVMRRPSPGELAAYLGMTIDSFPQRCFDLVVVGSGPAGLAAAVYGASEGLRTLVVEMVGVGGQAATTSRIENYLGFPTGISGGDLTSRAVVQAEKFGARVTSPCAATSLREEGGHLVVRLADGSDVAGRAVIVATGARYRRLDAGRLDDFEGTSVYYAATEIEARQCAAEPVVVVGGGNSAGQAALYMAAGESSVSVVIRGDDLGKSMSRYLVDRIYADPRIEVRTNAEVTALDGDRSLRTVTLSTAAGAVEVPCRALFSFIGADPSAAWLSGCAALDERGFVLTDTALADEHLDSRWEALGRRPLPFETSHPGLFAVGDVRAGSTKRVAAAVGEGSASVRSVHQHLAFSH